MSKQIRSESQLRALFWRMNPHLQRRYMNGANGRPVIAPQNYQPCDTRQAWCDFVDAMERDGVITDGLAQRATL